MNIYNPKMALLQQYQKMADEAQKANLAREQEIRGIYSNLIGGLTKDSPFYKAREQEIESQAKQLEGKETQGLISSGLYGTTTAASVPTRVATQFTQPSRLKLEDILQQRKSEAQLGLAGFVERIENPYPDYSALMSAFSSSASAPSYNPTPQYSYQKPTKSLSEWLRTDFGGY